MNQTDLIQNIIATEHQAQALTAQARTQVENMDASIQAEIDALREKYRADAEAYLQRLRQSEQEKSAQTLLDLDARLKAKLQQIESSYESNRDQWVQEIFERIAGKAGG